MLSLSDLLKKTEAERLADESEAVRDLRTLQYQMEDVIEKAEAILERHGNDECECPWCANKGFIRNSVLEDLPGGLWAMRLLAGTIANALPPGPREIAWAEAEMDKAVRERVAQREAAAEAPIVENRQKA
jgi:hypothetical protein